MFPIYQQIRTWAEVFFKKAKIQGNTPIDKSLLTRAYLPYSRGLTGSFSAASMSFSQLKLLAASQLDPPCQLLFPWFARFCVVLKQESKNQNGKFCH